LRKLIVFLSAVALGAASGIAAYRDIASKPQPANHQDSNRDDFDPGF
jgi:hypothetical protein